MLTLLRFFCAALIAAIVYLALTPGELGTLIDSGTERHLVAFAILPLVSAFAWPKIALGTQFAIYAALGAAIELAQGMMQVGRNAEWTDWGLDLVAAFSALAVAYMIRRFVFDPVRA